MKNMKKFNFQNLFILDIANNHQGKLDHGLNIIREHSKVLSSYEDMRFAFKFQFRDLPEFVHKTSRIDSSNKHVSRFLSTILTWVDFSKCLEEIRNLGFISICTPFDEPSVDKIVEMGFDVIKVASCSAYDWPLLEKISLTGLPVIVSTGGLSQSDVDNVVSFLTHKGCDFAIMHCVSIYPTPETACNLGNISDFKKRYPGTVIGWSTHEPPNETLHVGIASALGAEMFERHVGLESSDIKLNAYSSTPNHIRDWLDSYKKTKKLIGSFKREAPLSDEKKSIDELRRGVFAKKTIQSGTLLSKEDVYFAFPYQLGQLSSSDWQDGIVAKSDVRCDDPLIMQNLEMPPQDVGRIIKHAIHEVKALIAYAGVTLTHEFTTEYSHHFGVLNFRSVGVVLINVINRAYAKKILVQLPGQAHPMHYHKLKEETFIILWGELISDLDGRERVMKPGDTLTIPPGVWHSFKTDTGCVFEEISTTAYPNDSVYRNPEINMLSSEERKTIVDHWGRFQIKNQFMGKTEQP